MYIHLMKIVRAYELENTNILKKMISNYFMQIMPREFPCEYLYRIAQHDQLFGLHH